LSTTKENPRASFDLFILRSLTLLELYFKLNKLRCRR